MTTSSFAVSFACQRRRQRQQFSDFSFFDFCSSRVTHTQHTPTPWALCVRAPVPATYIYIGAASSVVAHKSAHSYTQGTRTYVLLLSSRRVLCWPQVSPLFLDGWYLPTVCVRATLGMYIYQQFCRYWGKSGKTWSHRVKSPVHSARSTDSWCAWIGK